MDHIYIYTLLAQAVYNVVHLFLVVAVFQQVHYFADIIDNNNRQVLAKNFQSNSKWCLVCPSQLIFLNVVIFSEQNNSETAVMIAATALLQFIMLIQPKKAEVIMSEF